MRDRSRIYEWMRVRTVALLCALSLLDSAAFATSIVVKFEESRILVVADSGATTLRPENQSSQSAGFCKIRVLGPIGFAVTGSVDYQPNLPSDPVPAWSAYSDALGASQLHGDNLSAVALDWARRSISHYSEFYSANPNRVKQIAANSTQNVLEIGFFAGWDKKASPEVLYETIHFDPSPGLDKLDVYENKIPSRELAYSSNATTQEFIDRETDRARGADREWRKLARTFPKNEVDWRQLEFYIKKTSEFDPGVSPEVSVLSIPLHGEPTWIRKGPCDADQSRPKNLR